MPRWGRLPEARAFLRANVPWIERERARQLQSLAKRPRITPGAHVLLRGVTCPVLLEASGPVPRIVLGDLGHDLHPGIDLERSVRAMLRRLAERELPDRLRALAASHCLTVSRISIRDQRTRWGSCSPSGRISLNWRLVQMPAHVSDYVLIHELMHLRVRNHSRRFWRQVAAACPEYEVARAWLREQRHLVL
jgi:predicted metal-dependent hydrolase